MAQTIKNIVDWLMQWFYTEEEIDRILSYYSTISHNHNIMDLLQYWRNSVKILGDDAGTDSNSLGFWNNTLIYDISENAIYYDKDGNMNVSPNILATLGDISTVGRTGSYNDLTDKPNIPSGSVVDNTLNASSNNAISNSAVTTALNSKADSTHSHQNYVEKNSTTGLLKNDGTVDTNNYLTSHQSISFGFDSNSEELYVEVN